MTNENTIQQFCADADSISVNTSNVESLKDLTIKISPKDDEIYRSRTSPTSCYFTMNLGFNKSVTLDDEILYMKTIELFYPDIFDWRFNGEHIQIINKIPFKKENLGIFTRYKSLMNFISMLRKRLLEVLKYREFNTHHIEEHVTLMILSNGSINNNEGMYVVDVTPDMNKESVLTKSKECVITNNIPRDLDMKFWVKEINPDFFKQFKVFPTKRKYPVTEDVYETYPPCIREIGKQKRKGNYARFLLATFLLAVHKERDAKHQLDMMLDKEERSHMNSGNCKDQWRAILVKEYSAPSCKIMIENGYCHGDCKRPKPECLEVEQ